MKRVRLLVDQKIEELNYKCNQVVELPNAIAGQIVKDGFADASDGAVAYAIDVLKAEPLVHTSVARASVEREIADAKVKLDDLEAKYNAEEDAKARAELGQQAEATWAQVKELTAKLEEMGD